MYPGGGGKHLVFACRASCSGGFVVTRKYVRRNCSGDVSYYVVWWTGEDTSFSSTIRFPSGEV